MIITLKLVIILLSHILPESLYCLLVSSRDAYASFVNGSKIFMAVWIFYNITHLDQGHKLRQWGFKTMALLNSITDTLCSKFLVRSHRGSRPVCSSLLGEWVFTINSTQCFFYLMSLLSDGPGLPFPFQSTHNTRSAWTNHIQFAPTRSQSLNMSAFYVIVFTMFRWGVLDALMLPFAVIYILRGMWINGRPSISLSSANKAAKSEMMATSTTFKVLVVALISLLRCGALDALLLPFTFTFFLYCVSISNTPSSSDLELLLVVIKLPAGQPITVGTCAVHFHSCDAMPALERIKASKACAWMRQWQVW